MIGALLGVLIIGLIQQGLILAGISVYWYRAGIGLLLIVAAVVIYAGLLMLGRRVGPIGRRPGTRSGSRR